MLKDVKETESSERCKCEFDVVKMASNKFSFIFRAKSTASS